MEIIRSLSTKDCKVIVGDREVVRTRGALEVIRGGSGERFPVRAELQPAVQEVQVDVYCSFKACVFEGGDTLSLGVLGTAEDRLDLLQERAIVRGCGVRGLMRFGIAFEKSRA